MKWICAVLLTGLGFPSFSQSQWTYDFNNGLSPIESGGIGLKKLGTPGQFVKEEIPGSEGLKRTVYQFEKNSGLQFDNVQGKGFLNKSFTVEIYFKLSELDSWKRVLDFKNRKSDYGSYIFDGKLNFYDFAIGEKAPVKANQYIHYVLSRDFETKAIKMYVNGLSKLEFKDPDMQAMLDADQVLNFFQDDLVANHEASAGSVALIRLYDRVMTPVFIRRSYQTISKPAKSTITPEEEITVETNAPPAEIPKTIPGLVTVSGKVFDGRNLAPINDVDVYVRKSKDDSILLQTKTLDGAYHLQLRPHESYKVSVEAPGFQGKSIAVKTTNRSEDIKSLISLSPETYDSPVATLLFTQSTDEIENEGKGSLDNIIAYFQKRPHLKIMLKGHTDNIGNFDKNVVLSSQRVQVVKNYLVEKGIPADRIEGVGYGSTRPSQINQSEEQRRKNRRVEVWAEPIKR